MKRREALVSDSKHFLVKDVDHPYNAVKDFRWFRGYQVGGRSLLWARHCVRGLHGTNGLGATGRRTGHGR